MANNNIYSPLTESGKGFMRRVATYFNSQPNGTKSLLQGDIGKLPYSDSPAGKTWIANITNKYTNQSVTNNNQLIEYLILLYGEYSKQYGVDANVLAAQGFQESEFRAWVYNNGVSTASGIPQFKMDTIYTMLYIYNKWVTVDEKNKITLDLESPERETSWRNVSKVGVTTEDERRQERNRSKLHQNIINNLDIVIKLQCELMNFIAKRNNNLAASSLFAYNRGSSLESNSYIQLINNRARAINNEFIKEGVNYTESVFRYLGDKNQNKVTNSNAIIKSYVRGFSFGYDNDIDFGFDSFVADSNSSYYPDRSTISPAALVLSLREGYDHAVTKFIAAHPGYSIVLSSVYRTPEYQNELFRKGRDGQGRIIGETVTPISGIPPNLSKHNYFNTKAFDFNIYDETKTYLDGMRIAAYRPLYEEFYNYVKEIEPKAVWGGGFNNQRNDVVHIQVA